MKTNVFINNQGEASEHWNHRLLASESNGELFFSIHEVYYDKNGSPEGYTKNPIYVGAENVDGVKWVLSKMMKCLQKPILWSGDRWPEEYIET